MKKTAQNKDINIRITKESHKRFKKKALRYGVSVKALLGEYSKGEWIRV